MLPAFTGPCASLDEIFRATRPRAGCWAPARWQSSKRCRASSDCLAALAIAPRIVRGRVQASNGNPFTRGFVQIFGRGPNGEHIMGKSELNPADGTYQISYTPASNGNARVDLRVAVFNDNEPVETTPSGDSVLADAGVLEVVNFAVTGGKSEPLSGTDCRYSQEIQSNECCGNSARRPAIDMASPADGEKYRDEHYRDTSQKSGFGWGS